MISTETTFPVQEIMNYWNSLANLPVHSNMESKVYKASVQYLKGLLSGQFSKFYPLDPDYVEEQGFTAYELSKSWSAEEIEQAIERFNYMAGSQHIADKKYYPRNMPDFIYNPRTRKSFILSLLGEFREVPGRSEQCLDIKVFNDYLSQFFGYSSLPEAQKNKLTRSVNYIIRQQRSFQETVGQFYHKHPLKDNGFFVYHRQFVDLEYYGKSDFGPQYIGPFTFRDFAPWLFTNFHINYSPKEQEIQQAKAWFEVETRKMQENDRSFSETLSERSEWLKNRGLNQMQGNGL